MTASCGPCPRRHRFYRFHSWSWMNPSGFCEDQRLMLPHTPAHGNNQLPTTTHFNWFSKSRCCLLEELSHILFMQQVQYHQKEYSRTLVSITFFRPETRWNSLKFKNSAPAPQSCSAMSYYFNRASVPTLSGGKQRSSLHTCPAAPLGR